MTDRVKTQETTVAATDWLASRPVFYNEDTGKVSGNINEVIDVDKLEFHPEGLHNYLAFGYSVLEQTPLRHVKFLRHSSRLVRGADGSLKVVYGDDPVLQWLERRTRENDVIDLIAARVHEWEDSVDGEICVPTSGGYDSRLLNVLVRNKARVRLFTYGVSRRQGSSLQVVYARRLAEKLGVPWQGVPLGRFHRYFDDWHRLFGVSTHAHGMYHIEFYRTIRDRCPHLVNLLSGIIGDGWSGGVSVPQIRLPGDLVLLGYTHGMHADPGKSRLPQQGALMERYLETHRDLLEFPTFRIVEAMRFKLILLSYLFTVPESLGFKPWSPFLNLEVAMSMLALPPERRRARVWQRDFFARRGLDFKAMKLRVSRENSLNHQAMRKVPVPTLDAEVLRDIIDPSYVRRVNRLDRGRGWAREWVRVALSVPRIARACRRLGVSDGRLRAYYAYLALKPLETVLRLRDSRARRASPGAAAARRYGASLPGS